MTEKEIRLPITRFDFSPMSTRKAITLPGSARVAVYIIVNIEAWDFDSPVPRQYFGAPGGAAVVPDIPNWSWHEYGMRVGFWRLLKSLQDRGLSASAAINGKVIESHYEPVARAVRDAGWAFMGHGYHQRPLHLLDDEAADIRRTFDVLANYAGRPPLGWLGPGLHETNETLDHLYDAGFRFVVDWPLDDHPVRIRTSSGSTMMSVPYSVETGDLPLMVAHQHSSAEWLVRIRDQFDCLYREGATQPRVMSMSVHPYIIGAPHRLRYFEAALDHILGHKDIWITTAEELYAWSESHI